MISVKHRARNREVVGRRGSALLIALLTVMAVASLSGFLFTIHVAGHREQVAGIDQKRAHYLAEAGLAEGAMAVIQGKSGDVGTAAKPAKFGDGVFWVKAENTGHDLINLKSVGLCGTGRVALETTIRRKLNPIASLAVFGDSGVTVAPGAVIDGFDSNLGPYTLDPTYPFPTSGSSGFVGSNGSIVLQSLVGRSIVPAHVFGDSLPGPHGSVVQDPGSTVTGSMAPRFSIVSFPQLVVPDPNHKGDVTVDANTLSIVGEDVQYGRVSIQNNGTLQIVGPARVRLDDFTLLAGSALAIDTSNGPVLLYFMGDLVMDAGSTLDHTGHTHGHYAAMMITARNYSTQTTTSVHGGTHVNPNAPNQGGPSSTQPVNYTDEIYGTEDWAYATNRWIPARDAVITIATSGEFHGIIYGPEVVLDFPASLRLFGGVVVSRLRIAQDAHITVNHALATSSIAGEGLPVFLGWRVSDVPETPLTTSPLDPLSHLDLVNTDLKLMGSSLAHRENFISIKYVSTADGSENHYEGHVAHFNWMRPRSVVGLKYYDPELDNAPTESDLTAPMTIMR